MFRSTSSRQSILRAEFGGYCRWQTAIKDKAFNSIRTLCLLETKADHILHVLEEGTVSTNVYLRRLHNFAVDMSWLPWPVLPKRRWPTVKYKQKRAITRIEHEAILDREQNHERKAFYQLAWHLGASQTDIALLEAENIDWQNRLISFARKKSKPAKCEACAPVRRENDANRRTESGSTAEASAHIDQAERRQSRPARPASRQGRIMCRPERCCSRR